VSLFDLFRFSAGALRGHSLRTGLCLLGVAIGVTAVILLTSLGEGARLYVMGEFSQLGGAAPIFGGVPHDLTVEDVEAIKRYVRTAKAVAPLAYGQAQARYGQTTREVNVAGTTAEFRQIREVAVRVGSYLPEGQAHQSQRVCVIGIKVQEELFPGQNPLGESLRIGEERFRIIGVMAPRGTSLGMNLDEVVHVPVRSALRMFNQAGLFRAFVSVRNHEEI
jgi:putative ABC transport system permease protein